MAHRGEIVKHLGGDKYEFRMRVPLKFVDLFGKTNWKHTFEALNPDQARRRGEEWYAHYKEQIAKAKSGANIYVPPKATSKSPLDKALVEAEAFFKLKRDSKSTVRQLESIPDLRDETELARAYLQTRKNDFDVEAALDDYLAKANIVIPKGSDLYKSSLQSFRPTVLSDLAGKIKTAKVRKIEAIDTNDLTAFESKVMNVREINEPDAPLFSEIYAAFLEQSEHHHIRDHKGERAKFDNAVRRFVECEGDLPVNKVSKGHTKRFYDLLKLYPTNRDSKSSHMTFKDAIAYHRKQGDYARPTTRTLHVWKRTLMRVFDYAIEFYSDEFPSIGINKFAIQSKYLVGLPSVERRDFQPEELNAMFSHPMFKTELDHRGWLMLLLLFHGARDGEIANKPLSAIKQAPSGIWYLEVGWSKGKSNRLVPIHQFILDQGFITDYVLPLKAKSAVWLFPQFNRLGKIIKGVRHDSKLPSASFSQWAGRFIDANVSKDPTITLHSFRHTWVTTATVLKIEKGWRVALVGHTDDEKEDVHEGTYTHLKHIDLKKAELDKVVFEGFPYNLFKRSLIFQMRKSSSDMPK